MDDGSEAKGEKLLVATGRRVHIKSLGLDTVGIDPDARAIEVDEHVRAAEGVWADQHHEEVAKAQAEATGVDIEAIRRFVDRSTYRVVPVNGEVIESQQAVADRFARLGLIPKPVKISEIVWKWTPGS